MNALKSFNKDNSDEKVERLTKLIETYNCFSSICHCIYFTRDEVKRFKSLVIESKRLLQKIIFIKYYFY